MDERRVWRTSPAKKSTEVQRMDQLSFGDLPPRSVWLLWVDYTGLEDDYWDLLGVYATEQDALAAHDAQRELHSYRLVIQQRRVQGA